MGSLPLLQRAGEVRALSRAAPRQTRVKPFSDIAP
jgi:hypothetical protein